jgi:dihydroorotase
VMADGQTADKLGVIGISRSTEICQVYLGLKGAQSTGCHVHLQHLSCAESVALVRMAKAEGLPVTAETCPHYLSLTSADVARLGTKAKMNPPLRGPADRKALKEGLIDGTIDVIATDHAPHTDTEKSLPLAEAPFGVIGLESAVPAVLTAFCHEFANEGIKPSKLITTLIAAMTINPAKILGLDTQEKGKKGMMEIGRPADVTIIDPKIRRKVDAEKFYSKARNCPWDGKRLQGWPVMTIHNGKIVMKDGKVLV